MATTGTAIEWTQATWNPVRGCSRVSEGCRHCYAERVAARFSGDGQPYEGLARRTGHGPVWTGKVRLVPEALEQPLRWRKGRRVFVNSMSDLFHENLRDEDIDRVFAVMALAPQHTFQVLTKRPERMLRYFTGKRPKPIADWVEFHGPATFVAKALDSYVSRLPGRKSARVPEHVRTFGQWADFSNALARATPGVWPLPHVWLGVSVEDQATADARIPLLLQTPAAVRFLSCEPLLGPVSFLDHRVCDQCGVSPARLWAGDPYAGFARPWSGPFCPQHYNPDDGCDGVLGGIDWVIVGGESGPGARPMHPAWARELRDQCQAAGVPFFFKQWGSWRPRYYSDGVRPMLHLTVERGEIIVVDERLPAGPERLATALNMVRLDKRAKGGRLLDGAEWSEFPS